MAPGLRSTLSAALVAFISTPLSSTAERHVTKLDGGKMAVVVHHRHLQHSALAPAAAGAAGGAAGGRGRNETLAQEVKRLNRTMLERTNTTWEERRNAALFVWRICNRLGPGDEARAALLPAAPGLLLAMTQDADARVQVSAAVALLAIVRKVGPEAAEPGVAVLTRASTEDESPGVRRRAAEILELLGRKETPAQEVKNETLAQEVKNETLAQEVERLNRTMLERTNTTWEERRNAALLLWRICNRLGPGDEARGALLPAAPGLLLAMTQDADARVQASAAFALLAIVRKVGPEAAEPGVAVLTRASTEDESPGVRRRAAEILELLGRKETPAQEVKNETLAQELERLNRTMLNRESEWSERSDAAWRFRDLLAKPGVTRATLLAAASGLLLALEHTTTVTTTDPTSMREEQSLQLVAGEALWFIVKKVGPEAAELGVALVMRLTEDAIPTIRKKAAKMRSLMRPEVVERSMLGLLPEISRLLGSRAIEQLLKSLDNLKGHASFFQWLDPVALERFVPALTLALGAAVHALLIVPYSYLAKSVFECVRNIGLPLSKVPLVAGPEALLLLTEAEKCEFLKTEGGIRLQIQSIREVVQGALQTQCADSFLNESGAVHRVDNLTVQIPFGVMLASDASGDVRAHRCPNLQSCSTPRRKAMRPTMANHSTKVRVGSCPLLLAAPLVSSQEATDEESSVCAAGFDPASPGCAQCIPGYGRKNKDPFACEQCVELGSAKKWAIWLAQPLLLFLLSLRSAENAAASSGMAEAVANDMVKIVLAYLSSISVVVSSVASTSAYWELDAMGRANEVLNLIGQTVQHGDVTYSSSSDCFIMSGRGAASVDQLLALSVQLPACVLAIAALLLGLRACCRAAFSGGVSGPQELWTDAVNTLVTCSFVAGNQFLPGVASACVRALPCFHTQVAIDGKYPFQVMSYEPSTKCRENTQLLWICGLMLVVTFVAGPVYWLVMLHRQREVEQTGPTRFLTGSYRAGFHWWESGRLIKTMLISCVVSASPSSYCPLQQLMLCLLVTVMFALWHCRHLPYKYFVLNVAEAGSLCTLIVGMVFAGLLASGGWSLDPGFRSNLVMCTAIVTILCFLGLAGLWLRVKFFWNETADEEVFAEGACDDGQLEGNAT